MVLEYAHFYFLTESEYVKSYEKIDEGFIGDKFGYIVSIKLSDNTEISVMVKRDSFKPSFFSEDTIVIDTMECTQRLQELMENNYLVTELSISEPMCIDLKEEEFMSRTLSFTGLESGGLGGVDYEYITEVDQEVIDNIP